MLLVFNFSLESVHLSLNLLINFAGLVTLSRGFEVLMRINYEVFRWQCGVVLVCKMRNYLNISAHVFLRTYAYSGNFSALNVINFATLRKLQTMWL